MQKKYNELEKDYYILQKNSLNTITTPSNSMNSTSEKSKFVKSTKLMKSQDEISIYSKMHKNEKFQIFLSIRNPKTTKSFSCPYIDIKTELFFFFLKKKT